MRCTTECKGKWRKKKHNRVLCEQINLCLLKGPLDNSSYFGTSVITRATCADHWHPVDFPEVSLQFMITSISHLLYLDCIIYHIIWPELNVLRPKRGFFTPPGRRYIRQAWLLSVYRVNLTQRGAYCAEALKLLLVITIVLRRNLLMMKVK